MHNARYFLLEPCLGAIVAEMEKWLQLYPVHCTPVQCTGLVGVPRSPESKAVVVVEPRLLVACLPHVMYPVARGLHDHGLRHVDVIVQYSTCARMVPGTSTIVLHSTAVHSAMYCMESIGV